MRAFRGDDVHLPVDVITEEVPAAEVGQDLARSRPDRDDGAVMPKEPLLIAADYALDYPLADALEAHVHGGGYAQAALGHYFLARQVARWIEHPLLAHLLQLVSDVEHEVGGLDKEALLLVRQLLGRRLVRLGLGNVAVPDHQVQHFPLPRLRPLRVVRHDRGVEAGGLRNPRQHRRLG